ncbi:helix-turn-helix domain-containing protein [Rhizobium oryzicola]|uniref:Helix-turn-helix domain-containing protein n=1 Tax=Rhizobium oryzicola TaxID=1232668 RepID=A0ABT8T1B4_9HYPH|nr:helix-turn-helix domain-containing protein [Rhizobium oryzicola]MDO1584442.1 helix-turn-helix domain-containing protein [Rhizobium oryzicola]
MAGTAVSDPLERVAIRLDDMRSVYAARESLDALFNFTPEGLGDKDGSRAKLQAYHFGFFLLCHTTGLSGRLTRSAAQAGLDDLDHLVVTMPISGAIGFAGLHPCIIRAGDVAISDLRDEIACTLRDSDALHLILPRLFLPSSVAPPDRMEPRILRGERVSTAFLRELTVSLARMPDYAGREEAMALAAVLRAPLALCLGTTERGTDRPDAGRRMREMRRHIEDNLTDPSLNPAALSDRFGLSRSQLFRQFEGSGGVETFIRKRRLRRALMDLADPSMFHRRIGDIAYDAGFQDEAHFSRLFRTSFGASPRSFRTKAKLGLLPTPRKHAAPSQDPASRFRQWLIELGDV